MGEAGSTCMDADVVGPIRIGNLDEERRWRSPLTPRKPAPVDFDKLSNEDFRRTWHGSDSTPEPEAPPAEPSKPAASQPAQYPVSERRILPRKPTPRAPRASSSFSPSFSSPEDMRKSWGSW